MLQRVGFAGERKPGSAPPLGLPGGWGHLCTPVSPPWPGGRGERGTCAPSRPHKSRLLHLLHASVTGIRGRELVLLGLPLCLSIPEPAPGTGPDI